MNKEKCMKNNVLIVRMGVILALVALLFAVCSTVSDDDEPTPEPTSVDGISNITYEELRSTTVGNATEMEVFLTSFNNEEYEDCIVAIGDSFTLDVVTLSSRSSSAVLIITSEGFGEKTISLSSLSIGSGVSLVLEKDVTLEGLDSGERLVQIGSGGAFTMKTGSKVHGNTGGGVFVDGGTFTMSGGEISGNTVSASHFACGGGVFVSWKGTFTMSGGEISGNTVSGSFSLGGGVYVYRNGTFTMSGGAISGNTASDGGGVCVRGGMFTMSSGEISSNTAFNGGGVYAGGTFTMSGGAISSNTASNGGGVYVYNNTSAISVDKYVYTLYLNGIFTKQSGGVIYGSNGGSLKNSASNGPAVYVYFEEKSRSTTYKRNTTAGAGVLLDSAKSGSAGGWQ
jgi:hypothetical protein